MCRTAVAVTLSVLVYCALAGGINNPSCYSTTNDYVHKSFTVNTQPLTPTLIQRYQGNQLAIYCLSFEEFGRSCGSSSVPKLCSRAVARPSDAFTCTALADYVTNPDADVTMGTPDGEEMIWLVKWDGTETDGSTRDVSCYPRQVEIRMLALVSNNWQSNKTVFGFLLALSILSVLLVGVGLYSYVRTRYNQIDSIGATTIAGPKQVYRGPQLTVTMPEAASKNVTTVYLPVRDSAALNEMTSSRISQFLNQSDAGPNTPHRKEIHLDEIDSDGKVLRGPGGGGSTVRRRRASPPAPGDGVRDAALIQRMDEARNMRRVIRRIGSVRVDGGVTGDDDALDYSDPEDNFDGTGAARARMLRRHDDGGEYDIDGTGSRGVAPRGRTPLGLRGSARRGAGQRPKGQGALFPTDAAFAVAGDVPLFDAPRSRDDSRGLNFDEEEPLEIYDDSGKPVMRPPSSRLAESKHSIKYVPQWMQGSFGRGGIIPESGDGHEAGPATAEAGGGSVYHYPSAGGDDGFGGSAPAKRFYQPEPEPRQDQENASRGLGPVGRSTPKRGGGGGFDSGAAAFGTGEPGSQPRSVLKRRSGNFSADVGGGGGDATGFDDPLRRGVSFEGDYVGGGQDTSGASRGAVSAAAGRAFGGASSRGGATNRDSQGEPKDSFSRTKAKTHNPALQLQPASERPSDSLRNDGSFSGPRGASGAAAARGERVAAVGIDSAGNPVYALAPSAATRGGRASPALGGSGTLGGGEAYECEECHELVTSQNVFCSVSGQRHF